jgi:hypothetical protein
MSKVNSYCKVHEAMPQCLRVLDKHYGAVQALLMLEVIDLSNVEDSFTPYCSDFNVIWCSFLWADSPQGHEYWLKVARYIELECEKRRVPDLEITISGVKIEGFARADETVVAYSDFTSLKARVAKNLSEER